jgi:hypothetical protein
MAYDPTNVILIVLLLLSLILLAYAVLAPVRRRNRIAPATEASTSDEGHNEDAFPAGDSTNDSRLSLNIETGMFILV